MRNFNIPIYFNNAATSFPKAPGMGKEVAKFLEELPQDPGRSGAPVEDILWSCRVAISDLINSTAPSQIVLTKNATESLNIALHGLNLKKSMVITTAAEHNSVLRPLYLLEKIQNTQVKIINCDMQGRVREDEWKFNIENLNPKAVVLNHASNVTGAINNAKKLLGYAKKEGCITILDASQSAGLIDLDINDLNADIIAFTGHKYLLGPTGTGGLYINPNIELEPFFVGGTGVRSDLKYMPPEMPIKLEAGTPSIPIFGGLLYSLKWLEDNPIPNEKINNLIKKLENGLVELGADVIHMKGERTPICSFRISPWTTEEIGFILEKSFGIVCRSGLHCAPLIHPFIGTAPDGSIRFSISRFNTENEVDYALDCMRKLSDASN